MKSFFSQLIFALSVGASASVALADNAAAPQCPVDALAFRAEFDRTKETPTKDSLRDAAVYLIYSTEGEPQKLATLIHEATVNTTKQNLERATSKYVKLLADKTLSPIAREYVENMYFAIGNRRGVPKVMIMEKIAYGDERQRAYRDAYIKLLREETEVRKNEQEIKAVEEAKRQAAEAEAP